MSSTTRALGAVDHGGTSPFGASLLRALDKIASQETTFTESFYEIFFRSRPDTVPLFGVHSIPEREEMMRETLHSLHGLIEGEPWLTDNLRALGKSHEEYGVTSDMYDSYCDSMIDCARQTLDEPLSDLEAAALRLAIIEVARQMSNAAATATAKSDRQGAAKDLATRSD